MYSGESCKLTGSIQKFSMPGTSMFISLLYFASIVRPSCVSSFRKSAHTQTHTLQIIVNGHVDIQICMNTHTYMIMCIIIVTIKHTLKLFKQTALCPCPFVFFFYLLPSQTLVKAHFLCFLLFVGWFSSSYQFYISVPLLSPSTYPDICTLGFWETQVFWV